MPEARRTVPESGVRPGLNDAGSAIAPNLLLTYDAAAGTNGVQLATTALVVPAGVSMESIPSLRTGDRQVDGVATVLTGAGGVNPGDQVTSDATGGGIATTTAGDSVHGIALTVSAAGETMELDLNPRPTVKA